MERFSSSCVCCLFSSLGTAVFVSLGLNKGIGDCCFLFFLGSLRVFFIHFWQYMHYFARVVLVYFVYFLNGVYSMWSMIIAENKAGAQFTAGDRHNRKTLKGEMWIILKFHIIFLFLLFSFHRKNKLNVCVCWLYGICELILNVISFVFFSIHHYFLVYFFVFFSSPLHSDPIFMERAMLRVYCLWKQNQGNRRLSSQNIYPHECSSNIFVYCFSSLFFQQRKMALCSYGTYIHFLT